MPQETSADDCGVISTFIGNMVSKTIGDSITNSEGFMRKSRDERAHFKAVSSTAFAGDFATQSIVLDFTTDNCVKLCIGSKGIHETGRLSA